MLKEIQNPRQNLNEKRRVFTDAFFDLYVWFTDTHEISGFQLCYDKDKFERAFTWTADYGYTHLKVDDGEGPNAAFKMKPVLMLDGVFDGKAIAEKFKAESSLIDDDIVSFVSAKIENYV